MSQIKIVKGNDAPIQWRVSYQGQPLDLTGKAVTLYVINSRGPFQLKSFEVEGNVVTATYYGADQTRFGEHSLVLRLNEGAPEMSTVAVKEAFELVEWSKDQGGESGEPIKVTPIILEADVAVAQGGSGGSYDDSEIRAELAKKAEIYSLRHTIDSYQDLVDGDIGEGIAMSEEDKDAILSGKTIAVGTAQDGYTLASVEIDSGGKGGILEFIYLGTLYHIAFSFLTMQYTYEGSYKKGIASSENFAELSHNFREVESQASSALDMALLHEEKLTKLSLQVSTKASTEYVDNAIAEAITNELNATFNYAE